jgi:hypothetical protein
VGLDEYPVGTFAQGLGEHRRQAGVDASP